MAQEAVTSTKEVVSSRNDGLIIRDPRLYQDETNAALSETDQNILTHINSSLICNQNSGHNASQINITLTKPTAH